MGLALKGRTAEAAVELDRAGELLPEVEPVSAAAQSISFALMGRLGTGDEASCCAETRGLAARRPGEPLARDPALVSAPGGRRRVPARRMGRAERDAEDAVENAEISGQLGPLTIALIIRARIHAARGREEAARADAHRGVEIAEPVGYGSVRLWSLACLGFLELGRPRRPRRSRSSSRLRGSLASSGLEDPSIIPWAADLIEA